MVNVLSRARKLRSLLSIRNGPGAAMLPPEVTRIHMDFSSRTDKGHLGAKRFWREPLTRLKYYNPAIPMTVSRSRDASSPALMTLTFSPSTSSGTPPTESVETTKVIDMKNLPEPVILEQLMTLTNARAVRQTPEDARLTQELEEEESQNNRVREMMKAVREKRKKEADILKQARGEMEALKTEA